MARPILLQKMEDFIKKTEDLNYVSLDENGKIDTDVLPFDNLNFVSLDENGKISNDVLPEIEGMTEHGDEWHIDNSISENKLKDEVINKINSALIEKTLLATEWTGTEIPYTYDLSVEGVTSTSIQEIIPGISISIEELSILCNSNIHDAGQSIDNITLKCFSEKPEIDLPIRIILRGDL